MRSASRWIVTPLCLGLLAAACADPPQRKTAAFGSGGGNGPGQQGQDSITGEGDPSPDAGADMDSGTADEKDAAPAPEPDAGPQCNVSADAARGFHCTYINRIASGILAPPDSGLPQIQGCRDFPPEVSEAEAQAACDEIFPALEGSVMVAAGPCDGTGAVGYCSDIHGSRDFAYHSDCNIMNSQGGSGSWACDKVVPDEAGWVCLSDESQSWERNCSGAGTDAGTPDTDAGQGDSCDAPSDGDQKTYRCEYVNGIASDAVGHDVSGCKQYSGTWTRAAAEADCKALVQADKGKTIAFAEGSCTEAGQNGYCVNGRGDREYSYEGGCNAAAQTSGAWACNNFGVGGQNASCASWVCAGVEPDRSCVVQSPASGKPGCRNFPFNTSEAAAKSACDAKGGTVNVGFCDTEGAVATCTTSDGAVDVYTSGSCSALEASCTGSFACLKEPEIWSCKVTDTGFGCSNLPGLFQPCDFCIDYSEAGGWTEASARANCETQPKYGSFGKFGTSPSCEESGYEERCVNDDGTRGYGDGRLGNDCEGSVEEVNAACEPTLTGIITCRYTDPNANGPACIDYPTKLGWTEQDATAHCLRQEGSAQLAGSSVKIDTDGTKSCLAVEGATTGTRCTTKLDASLDWFAYGPPAFVCSNFMSGTSGSGPFCSGY